MVAVGKKKVREFQKSCFTPPTSSYPAGAPRSFAEFAHLCFPVHPVRLLRLLRDLRLLFRSQSQPSLYRSPREVVNSHSQVRVKVIAPRIQQWLAAIQVQMTFSSRLLTSPGPHGVLTGASGVRLGKAIGGDCLLMKY